MSLEDSLFVIGLGQRGRLGMKMVGLKYLLQGRELGRWSFQSLSVPTRQVADDTTSVEGSFLN